MVKFFKLVKLLFLLAAIPCVVVTLDMWLFLDKTNFDNAVSQVFIAYSLLFLSVYGSLQVIEDLFKSISEFE